MHGKLLGRTENRIQFKKDGRWCVEYDSVVFYHWFKQQNLETLKPYIEHRERCARAFLRAFFDGDGSNNGRQVFAYHSSRELLEYVKIAGEAWSENGKNISRC